MISVELLPASQGDCIFIEYGKDKDSLHRILIDGGTKGTYKYLKQRILQIPKEQRVFTFSNYPYRCRPYCRDFRAF